MQHSVLALALAPVLVDAVPFALFVAAPSHRSLHIPIGSKEMLVSIGT